ncbi:MAG: alpha/beta hydrolase [Gammaproteobacteria bacterium]|nr:alpha/beta hydrolase [Gammaproteobacteria bacterium]
MRSRWVVASVLATSIAGCGGVEAPVDDPSADVSRQEEKIVMEESPVAGVTFRFIETNGIRMRIAEMGDEGPLVLLAHGWPESWYSWRHQIPALANAGYRVVVPEMRGYGETDAPESVDDYDIVHLAGDMVGVLDAVGVKEGEEKATIVGHDWGAVVAANSVLLHPDRFSSLVLMSVPYRARSTQSPMDAMTARVGDNFFYILYHNEPGGVADAEYDGNPRGLLSRLYLSPDSPREAPEVTDPKRSAGGWIPRLGAPKGLPGWLTPEDLDYYVTQFESSGFRGGVNYYRNFQRNWEITEHLADAKIEVPTLFIAGQKDVVIGGATAPMLTKMMEQTVTDLRDVVIVPEIGHWIQQEDPVATNEALLSFLNSL